MDALDNLLADHGYQGLLHHGLRDDVCEGSTLHELHDNKQMHLHQVCLQTENSELSKTHSTDLFEIY